MHDALLLLVTLGIAAALAAWVDVWENESRRQTGRTP